MFEMPTPPAKSQQPLVGDRLQQMKAGHGRSIDRSMLYVRVRTERKRADEDHGRQDEDDERRAAQPRDQLPHAVLPRDGGHERHAREVSSCRIKTNARRSREGTKKLIVDAWW